MNRRKIVFIVTFLLFFLMPLSVRAQGTVVIRDDEDLFTEKEEAALRRQMERITEYGNAALITVSQYGDTGSYAKKTYRSMFGTDSGFLFVIDMGKRNIWIYSDGAIYRTVNRAYANTITDNIYTYASRKEYYRCAYEAFDQALILLEGGKIAQPMKYISNALIALVTALLINFLILTLMREPDTPETEKLLTNMTAALAVTAVSKKMVRSHRTRHIESSGGSSGGGSSGGGGGGGSSGGGGGHSF